MEKIDGVYISDLGSTIRKIREKRRIGLSELARKANISKSYLSEIERELKEPTLRSMIAISKALDVHISMIFCMWAQAADIKGPEKARHSILTAKKQLSALLLEQ